MGIESVLGQADALDGLCEGIQVIILVGEERVGPLLLLDHCSLESDVISTPFLGSLERRKETYLKISDI